MRIKQLFVMMQGVMLLVLKVLCMSKLQRGSRIRWQFVEMQQVQRIRQEARQPIRKLRRSYQQRGAIMIGPHKYPEPEGMYC